MALEFDPNADRFSANNALYLATASAIAYMDEKSALQRTDTDLGLDRNFQFFDINNPGVTGCNTQAFAAASSTHAILAFRGTEQTNLKDWMSDLTATPADSQWLFSDAFNVGAIHAGFGNAVADSWSPISDWIRVNVITTGLPLWITGHSLGGSLAVLSAAVCSYDPQNLGSIHGVYTFGQPRVGFHNFCQLVDNRLRARIFRLVNRKDIVARVPFRSWDYGDVGQMIHFESTGIPVLESPEWKHFLLQPFNDFGSFFNMLFTVSAGIEDHNIAGYIKAIQEQQGALDKLEFDLNY